ncbi:MAG TPA: inositol monophosphatase [Rhodospirillaceae bacterium]|jgi:myo-inositol-1(or 4)-monophosphatase|nr:inositol monophosphatase [Alphaproteobacteria bacterium]HBH25803.1 inositol monophosphatase [Rhodospirillaceae bacterium]
MTMAIRAAERAGRSLARDFGEVENLQVSRKGPGDFVSAADHRAEEIIFKVLSEAYPQDGFLMEEGGAKPGTSGRRWIIDPLDGTANFLHGIPHWSVSIALEEDGRVVAGLVHDPCRGEMFTAERSQGAFLHRRGRLRVAAGRGSLSPVVLVGAPRKSEGDGKEHLFLEEYGALVHMGASPRRFGSAALDLAYVAAGRVDGFWERYLQPWDIAAGTLIVREAGGLVADCDDDAVDPLATGAVLAATPDLFGPLKDALRPVRGRRRGA